MMNFFTKKYGFYIPYREHEAAVMKMQMAILFFLSLCAPSLSQADDVVLEGGFGFYKSSDSQAVFLRYQKESSPLFGIDSYYDAALASWNGNDHNDALIITKGIRIDLVKETYFAFEAGGAYLERTTHNLGTRLQFAFRFALGMKVGAFDLGIGYNHLSNGKGIFHWTNTTNYGENFITCQLGYVF
ncbi:MAG TPA: acyloxyacyl hydrolase [Nitrospirota bacterium]|nr:acyloxyacyl hydrolase [Nitrospirota bacterium]